MSYEAFHRSGLATVCPITASRSHARYPNEVAIPVGQGGQPKDGVILCHQVRTVSLERARSLDRVQYVTDRTIRASVREALTRQLGLDIPDDEGG